MAIEDKFEHDIDNLIETGKEKGYLTYGDVNDILPEEIGSPDDLDDLITTIDGLAITSSVQFNRIVAGKLPGTRVAIRILRDGREYTLNAEIGEETKK